MKFVSSIPAVLLILLAGNTATASRPVSEPQSSLPIELASEKQWVQTQPTTDTLSLVRTLRNLLAIDVRSFDSSLSITAAGPTFSFSTDIQIQTITAQPNQFQSRVQFVDPNKGTTPYYTFTSDGQQVWIYDSEQNIYSVMTYREFQDEYKNNFLAGFFTSFFFGVLEEAGENTEFLLSIPEEQLLQDDAFLTSMEASLGVQNSTMGTETFNGTQYTTLSYADPEGDFTMTMFIDPATSLIEDIHIMGQTQGLDMFMREDVVHKAPPASLPQDLFTFVPPAGAQLSETPISIGPF
ncbi:MAG: hypothetical protein F6K16_31365 [Symploca sp. SIO2B6]|nr:hypothetical protein [Symploca sp. SIO2B6]